MMKAYKVILLIVDHDDLGPEEIGTVLERQKYPNWCIYPRVQRIFGADIGEWTDEHPLNQIGATTRDYDWRDTGVRP
jgi:hypothetical protein